MSTLSHRVRDHAYRVRRWVEFNCIKLGGHSPCLEGLCAIASAELWRRLRKDGIRAKLGHAQDEYEHHVFVIVDDHIIDITATQFNANCAKVEVRPVNHLLHPWYWKVTETFDSDDALHVHQTDTDWVIWQRANQHLVERKSHEQHH